MSKRQKYVFTSLLLAIGLYSTQLVPIDNFYRYLAIFGLFIVSYFVSAWALFSDMKGVEWAVLVPFPGFYAVSVALFYYLLPESIISLVFIFLLFGIGTYSLLLISNIFSVAAIKMIPLYRAALAWSFIMQLITSLFFYNSIFSFRFPFFVNAILVFLVSFPIVLHGLWVVKLEAVVSKQIINYSLTVAFILAQLAAALSFWPATVWIASISLVTGMYVFLGLLQHHLQDRLFRSTFKEYIFIGVAVLIVMMVFTPWRSL